MIKKQKQIKTQKEFLLQTLMELIDQRNQLEAVEIDETQRAILQMRLEPFQMAIFEQFNLNSLEVGSTVLDYGELLLLNRQISTAQGRLDDLRPTKELKGLQAAISQ